MSSHKDQVVTGKSPYAKSNRTWRARGVPLIITVVILLIAVGAWMVSLTKAEEHASPAASQTVDPAAVNGSGGADRLHPSTAPMPANH